MERLSAYTDSETMAELQSRHESIQHLLDAIGYKTKGGNKDSACFHLPIVRMLKCTPIAELPIRVKEALLRLATEARIKELEAILRQHVDQDHELDEDEDCLPENIEIPTSVNWEEGTEHLNTKSLDELWAMLGLAETKAIPGFNDRIDTDGVRNPWDPEDKAWFKDKKNGMNFRPRWHQTAGIVMLTEMFFAIDINGLLADEVGLGKTHQVTGHICVIRYFREYYAVHKKFPGAFGEDVFILYLYYH